MFCTNCGSSLSSGTKFCPQCGVPVTDGGGLTTGMPRAAKTLLRPRMDRKVAGVCAGIAQYLGVDVTLVQVLVICFSIWPPLVGVVFYAICWIVIPNEPILLMPPTPINPNPVSGEPGAANV